MNWDQIEGNWKQFIGRVTRQWGRIIDDDLAKTNGDRKYLEGVLQKRYGCAREKARTDLDAWSLKPSNEMETPPTRRLRRG